MELNICHLYPDILNLYGDRGNIITMKRRMEDRGIKVNVEGCSIGETLDANRYDIFFIGGGQDFEQEVLLKDLGTGKAAEIRAAVEDEKTFLAICGGYQMLGQYYKTWDGVQLDFTGAINIHTVGSKERMIGNYMFETLPESSGAVVVGFENHSGKTYLGEGVSPLGKMLKGYGNNGEDQTEGARYKNVFGTYSHGSLLPKNPVLCDFILQTALERKYGQIEPLAPLEDTLECLFRKCHCTQGSIPPVQWHFVPSMIQQGKTLPVKYGGCRGKIISFDLLIVQWREDSKIVEAIADTIFAFRGFSEWFAQWNRKR